MADLPRITLVTPSFNQAEFLEETIRSVLGQDYPNLEYFVMDGGSTDGSVEIIQRYGDRLTGWVSEPDQGHADAVNKGMARGTGDILGFLNSDDVLFPDALDYVGGYFREHPECDWAAGGCQFFSDEPLEPDCPHQLETWFPREDLSPLDFLEGCPLPQPSTFWRRRVHESVGSFSGRIPSLDYEYWLRLLLKGYRPKVMKKVLSGWRLHSGSQSVADFDRNIQANMDLAREYLPRLIPDGAERRCSLCRLEGVFALYLTDACVRRGQKVRACRQVMAGVWRYPALLYRRSAWAALLRAFAPAWLWRPVLGMVHRRRGLGADPRALGNRPYIP